MGWHQHAAVYKTIIGISLDAPCTIEFRTRTSDTRRVFKHVLAPRSVYVFRDAARDEWQHRIAPTKSERFSLTLRSLSSAASSSIEPYSPLTSGPGDLKVPVSVPTNDLRSLEQGH